MVGNLKTQKFHGCVLIVVCAVIKSDTIYTSTGNESTSESSSSLDVKTNRGHRGSFPDLFGSKSEVK